MKDKHFLNFTAAINIFDSNKLYKGFLISGCYETILKKKMTKERLDGYLYDCFEEVVRNFQEEFILATASSQLDMLKEATNKRGFELTYLKFNGVIRGMGAIEYGPAKRPDKASGNVVKDFYDSWKSLDKIETAIKTVKLK